MDTCSRWIPESLFFSSESVVFVLRWSLETLSVPSRLLDQPRPSPTKPWSRFWRGFTPNTTAGPRLRSSSGRFPPHENVSYLPPRSTSSSEELRSKCSFCFQPAAAASLWPLGLPQRSKLIWVYQDLPDCCQEMAFLWCQIIRSRGHFWLWKYLSNNLIYITENST